MHEHSRLGTRGNERYLLLALAPWPTLLSLIRERPADWTIWGEIPQPVGSRFADMGTEICSEGLPRPFHKKPLPGWVHRSWRGIVVPALGHPLPSRLPVLRHMLELSCPLFVASHGRIRQAPQKIPATDAFSWAFDRLDRPEAEIPGPSDGSLTCVRADLLGDILLALPALASLSAKQPTRLVIRSEWLEWIRLLATSNIDSCGVCLDPWVPPSFKPTSTVLDLSPPGWTSPLTPALARSIPAQHRRRFSYGHQQDSLAAMIATEFDLDVSWPERTPRNPDFGLIVYGGSSSERSLPPAHWAYVSSRFAESMGVREWLVIDGGDGRADALASAIGRARPLTYPQLPSSLVSLCRSACVVLGVSTAITHLAALTGTPALVIEHPTTIPYLYRSPVPYVRYIRPQCPWWHDDPSESDLNRAFDSPEESYGFLPGEWEREVDSAMHSSAFLQD